MLAIKILCFILGLFEFFAVYIFQTTSDQDLLRKHDKILPHTIITDDSIKIVYCGFLLMLGLQRLTWATVNGQTSLYSWIVLIITHIIECFVWYILALEKNNFNLQTLIIKAITFELGEFPFLVLIGVPILCLVFIICAVIDLFSKKQSKSSKKEKL
jgi:hypothetical protein